ncbi:MAG TPA: Na+/H+ antiporter subunit E [Devosiaceae bacterium]|jgi:multicomponent Na+:H+ antiporter subunit E
MSLALVAMLLALGWAAMTGTFTLPNVLLGLVVGLLALLLLRDRVESPRLLIRLWRILRLVGVFIYELCASGVKVGLLALSPNLNARLRPAIVAFPLTVTTDAQITLLANLITLTPGTLSVDVSDDRGLLYIHVLDLDDRAGLIRDIAAGFEARVIEVFA